MPETEACLTCALLAARDTGTRPRWDNIYRTDAWDVVHSYNTSLPGWLVLVARRHIAAIADLTPAESSELGLLITRVSQALAAVTGCTKTYAIQFAEAAGHAHVHVHVVPRMADLPADRRGPRIFGYLGVPEAERVPDTVMDALATRIRTYLQQVAAESNEA